VRGSLDIERKTMLRLRLLVATQFGDEALAEPAMPILERVLRRFGPNNSVQLTLCYFRTNP
jgi:hypothetical protein